MDSKPLLTMQPLPLSLTPHPPHQLEELVVESKQELAAADRTSAGSRGPAARTSTEGSRPPRSSDDEEDDAQSSEVEEDEDDFRDMGHLSASELGAAEAAAGLLAAAQEAMRAVSRPLLEGEEAGRRCGRGGCQAEGPGGCVMWRAAVAYAALDAYASLAFPSGHVCTLPLTAAAAAAAAAVARPGPEVTGSHCLDEWESMAWHAQKLRSSCEALVACLYPPHVSGASATCIPITLH